MIFQQSKKASLRRKAANLIRSSWLTWRSTSSKRRRIHSRFKSLSSLATKLALIWAWMEICVALIKSCSSSSTTFWSTEKSYGKSLVLTELVFLVSDITSFQSLTKSKCISSMPQRLPCVTTGRTNRIFLVSIIRGTTQSICSWLEKIDQRFMLKRKNLWDQTEIL